MNLERKVNVARKKQHYVDNEKFLVVMSDYREEYLQAKDNDTELPLYQIMLESVFSK
jgi:hypothetical protein